MPPTPAPVTGPSVLQIILALVGDAGDIQAAIQAIETAVAGEATATTFLQRVKLAEPAAEAVAALVDKIKGQV
jgi:hypothetical protein